MTEFFRRGADSTALWWPVILRAGLWTYIGIATAAIALFHNISAEEMILYGLNPKVMFWIRTWFDLTNAGAIALRLYFDQSSGKHAEKVASNEASSINSLSHLSPPGA